MQQVCIPCLKTDLSVPLQHQSVDLQIGFLVREHGKEVDHREPPGKDDKGLETSDSLHFPHSTTVCIFPHLEGGDGDAEQLELLREVEDGEEDGAEEGDLQEAEHDQPREQEVAHSPAASKRGREIERGDNWGRAERKYGGRN